MVTINNAKLKEVLEAYKLYFKDHIDDEIYKWIAVKKFQDSWNIDAPDFKTMLKEATSKHENLLVSRQKYPLAMILEFCDKEVETIREMFRNLFDESLELKDRLISFRKNSDALVDKYAPGKMHYQDINTMSTYLWLRYPDKYYIYKYSSIKSTSEILESSVKVKRGGGSDSLEDLFKLLDIITEYIQKDPEIRVMLDAVLTENCFIDKNLHTLAIDINYFIGGVYFKQYASKVVAIEKNPKYWIYSPGEGARMWDDCISNGLMCLGWESLGDYTQYETREDMVKKMQIDFNTDRSCKNDSLATWEFAYEMTPGDVIFAKRGRSTILGRGVVLSNYIYDDKRQDYKNVRSVKWEKIGEWTLDELTPMKTLTDITKYANYVNRLNALVEGNSIPEENCNYWYLCTNPKMFSIMDWPVGDTQEFTLKNANGNKRQRPQNFLDARAGDKVICYASSPIKQVTSLAIVSKEQDGEIIEFEKTETLPYPVDLKTIQNTPELQGMEGLPNFQGTLFKLTKDEYDKIVDLVRESNAPVNQKLHIHYTEEDFLNEVYLPKGDFEKLKNLLINKKNIILQGAPGVGKTFSARRLAYAMMKEKDDSRISLIQFHQNYSYEDFILGYKPSGDTFELQRGIFYKFCINAANNPSKDYFFIIDEINRGNLSKIFGELMMLIEKDYRGQKLTLAYNDEAFFVPKNVYIIGMMNTADRSLAMIDYALRRRFSFFEMKPGFESEGFKEYKDKFDNEHFNKLIELIKNLNENIRKDDSLGEGFEIGHSYFCGQDQVDDNWLHQVIDYDIIPMLNEYWFDNKKEIENWKIKLNSIFND